MKRSEVLTTSDRFFKLHPFPNGFAPLGAVPVKTSGIQQLCHDDHNTAAYSAFPALELLTTLARFESMMIGVIIDQME